MNAQKTVFSAQKQASGRSEKSPRLEPTTSCTSRKRSPKLRHHKATGQAYVVLNGKYIFFGPYGSPDVAEQYHRTIAEWHAAGKNPPSEAEQTTINELIARYWTHVEEYYSPDGTPTTEQDSQRYALRPLLKLYGNTKAAEFGPRCLRALQRQMVEMGWCRNTVNRSISRVKMLFKWGVSHELLPATSYQALSTVAVLRHGRSEVHGRPSRSNPSRRSILTLSNRMSRGRYGR